MHDRYAAGYATIEADTQLTRRQQQQIRSGYGASNGACARTLLSNCTTAFCTCDPLRLSLGSPGHVPG
eukprot:1896109-Rhodomonas_salina.1